MKSFSAAVQNTHGKQRSDALPAEIQPHFSITFNPHRICQNFMPCEIDTWSPGAFSALSLLQLFICFEGEVGQHDMLVTAKASLSRGLSSRPGAVDWAIPTSMLLPSCPKTDPNRSMLPTDQNSNPFHPIRRGRNLPFLFYGLIDGALSSPTSPHR